MEHGLGEIITSLTEAGLKIDFFNEYQESPYAIFPNMVEGENGLFYIKNGLFPLLFEIKATKPEELNTPD